MYHHRHQPTPCCFCAAAVFFLLSLASEAAEFNVTSNADSGPGSLREAVALANASPGADTIIVTELPTIELESGQIDITDTLTILGHADGTVIDGRAEFRIFGVTAPGTALRIERLVLTNAFAQIGNVATSECGQGTTNGGAICALGPLEIVDTRVLASLAIGGSGGGIWVRSPGTVLLENSTIHSSSATQGNGGGIFAATDALTVINSRIYGNNAAGSANGGFDGSGGGIYFDGDGASIGSVLGDLTVLRSEIADNAAGGLNGDGGGIWVQGQTVISNATLSGNRTTGGVGDGAAIYSAGGNTNLLASTVTDNQSVAGGAVEIDDGAGSRTLNIESSILAANVAPADNLLTLGPITVNATASVFGDGAGEINGVSAFNVFTNAPVIDPLADNGCFAPAGVIDAVVQPPAGCVRTHAVTLNSPARDSGNDLGDVTDQRGQGFNRVVGPRADAGAYELANIANPPSNPNSPGVPGTPGPSSPNSPHAVPAVPAPALLVLGACIAGLAGRKLRRHASVNK